METADSLHQNGSHLYDVRRTKEAWDMWRKALQIDPDHLASHRSLAVTQIWRDNMTAEAVGHLLKWIELDPIDPAPHNQYGQTLLQWQRTDEAVDEINKAIALGDKTAYMRRILGNIHRDRGDHDEAISWYREAIRLDPKDDDAHLALGDMLSQKGMGEQAIAEWRVAAERPYATGVRSTACERLAQRVQLNGD